MTLDELQATLSHLGIPADAYSLNGEARDECYVLRQTGTRWVVFYSERGLRRNERSYPSETEAADSMLRRLRRDFMV